MPAGAVGRASAPRRAVLSDEAWSRPPREPGRPCAPTPAREPSGRFAVPAPRPRSGVYGEAVPSLTRFLDAVLRVSPALPSGMRARDDVPSADRARGAAAFVVRRLALVRVDGPVSSLAAPMSAVCVPRPALAPRPPPIDDCRRCGVPRLACVSPPVPRAVPALRAPFDAVPDARPAPADFDAPPARAPLPADAAREPAPLPRDGAVPEAEDLAPVVFEPVRFAPAVPAPPALRDAVPRDAVALRAAPVEARSDTPPRAVAAFVPDERDVPVVLPAFDAPDARAGAVPRAAADFAAPAFDAPAPLDAVLPDALRCDVADFAVAPFEVALLEVARLDDALFVVEPLDAADFDVPVDFVAPPPAPADFDAPGRVPLPRDGVAPLPRVPPDADRVEAEDFLTAAPREAACSSPPSASRALFERPACFLIVVPACVAPGAVRPPAVVAMGMLRSNVAPAGARPS